MKNIYIPIALLLIGVGLLLGPDMSVLPSVPDWVNPSNWFVKPAPTVVIIEETKVRSSLPATQLALMNSTTFPKEVAAVGGTFLGCFDQNIGDRDKKVPVDLAPYLEAAKETTLPALVIKRGSKITAIPLSIDETTAIKVIK